MRIVMMGTPAFAVPTLEALLAHHDVVAVYTRPDRASGRGRKIVSSPMKERAMAATVPVEQPITLRDEAAVERLRSYAPDAIVVAAYGLILPPDVLSIPRHGCVNVHGSLLPRWRGAAPVQRAILAGDAVTGVSIMRIEEGLDTGPWCLQVSVPVDEKSADALTAELAHVGAGALVLALDGIEHDALSWTGQDDSEATYAQKLSAHDVALAPDLSATEALRRVRASGPSAPCRVLVGQRRLIVLSASPSTADLLPGEVSCARTLDIGLSDRAVRLDMVVPEGRAPMPGDAFARGSRLGPNCFWTAS